MPVFRRGTLTPRRRFHLNKSPSYNFRASAPGIIYCSFSGIGVDLHPLESSSRGHASKSCSPGSNLSHGDVNNIKRRSDKEKAVAVVINPRKICPPSVVRNPIKSDPARSSPRSSASQRRSQRLNLAPSFSFFSLLVTHFRRAPGVANFSLENFPPLRISSRP